MTLKDARGVTGILNRVEGARFFEDNGRWNALRLSNTSHYFGFDEAVMSSGSRNNKSRCNTTLIFMNPFGDAVQ